MGLVSWVMQRTRGGAADVPFRFAGGRADERLDQGADERSGQRRGERPGPRPDGIETADEEATADVRAAAAAPATAGSASRRRPGDPGPAQGPTALTACGADPGTAAAAFAAPATATRGTATLGTAAPATATRGTAAPAAAARASVPDTCHAADRDGTVSVRDGRVRIRQPRGVGRWPSVEPGEPLTDHLAEVRINGRPLTGCHVVRETDRIEVVKARRIVPGGIDVEVSPDELRAWVTVHPPVCHEARLFDAKASLRQRLDLRVSETRLEPEATVEDVAAAVERAGVQIPLRDGAVARALASPGERVPVAEGMAAGRGQPTSIWNFFDRESHVWRGAEERHAGRADAWTAVRDAAGMPAAGRTATRAVEMGETLLVVRPGRPGRSGYTVGGEVLTDGNAVQPRLTAGPGVMLSKDGLTAIAAQSGDVAITVGPDRIGVAVYEQRFVDGNVASGSRLHVRGDLHVGGCVEPNCDIFAAGRVEVGRDVLRARIEAGGGIEIRGGVSNGLLLAGGAALLYTELFADCEGFVEAAASLDRTTGEERATWSDWADDGWTPRLRRMGFRLASALQKADLQCDPEVVEFGRSLSEAMARRRVAPLDVAGGELRELLRQAAAAAGCMRAALALPAHCRVGHLDYARLEVTGDVDVTGSGCYRSNIKAGGSVRVAGRFRSGSVVGSRDASFDEIGSPGEVVTRVQLPADGRFTAQLVHPGTIVRIGLHTRSFELTVRGVVLGRDAPADAARVGRASPRRGHARVERAAV